MVKIQLCCPNCDYELQKDYPSSSYQCERCGSGLSISIDYSKLQGLNREKLSPRQWSLWRYKELMQIPSGATAITLGEGGTHLHKCDRLAQMFGVKRLYIKDETTNPTGSFLDRGSSLETTVAVMNGCRSAVALANGNFGASIAAYSAKAGIDLTAHITLGVDLGKLYQILACSSNVRISKNLAEARIHIKNVPSGTHVFSQDDPFFVEGKKTIAWEIFEQLDWRPPDWLILPMGSGALLSLSWKAIYEMREMSFVNSITSLVGVQPKGCSPIVEAFHKKMDKIRPGDKPRTKILDLSSVNPNFGNAALRAIKESKGFAVSVSDEEAYEFTKVLARTEGIFAEPAACSTLACLKEALESGLVSKDESIVCVVTGAGLKDPRAIRSILSRSRELEEYLSVSVEANIGRTKLAILSILNESEVHGYGVWKLLNKRYGIKVKLPAVYQHLAQLERMGMIKASGRERIRGRLSRSYSLTDKGRGAI
ncbi:MAG: pyridoxal-phosphate dependent enzyme [Thermoproteota archaeon]